MKTKAMESECVLAEQDLENFYKLRDELRKLNFAYYDGIPLKLYKPSDGEVIVARYVITFDNLKSYKLYEYKNDTAIYTKHKNINPLNLEQYMSNI